MATTRKTAFWLLGLAATLAGCSADDKTEFVATLKKEQIDTGKLFEKRKEQVTGIQDSKLLANGSIHLELPLKEVADPMDPTGPKKKKPADVTVHSYVLPAIREHAFANAVALAAGDTSLRNKILRGELRAVGLVEAFQEKDENPGPKDSNFDGTDYDNRFNEILEPTSMRVAFDSAQFAIGGWLQSYGALSHPTTAGVQDDRNQFGVVIGASVEGSWWARPLLTGKWGWNDPGDEAGGAMMGNGSYETGEQLGDLIFAAEERYGDGTVMVFGDTSSLTNGITIGSHDFTSRLLGYLASRPGNPQDVWRQILTLLLGAGLLVLLWRLMPGATKRQPWSQAVPTPLVVGLCLAGSLGLSTMMTNASNKLLPDGRLLSKHWAKRDEAAKVQPIGQLAYIDGTHHGRFSDESWRMRGDMGLKMTMMRDGFLTLELPEFTPARLERAKVLISTSPRREFTASEIETAKDFVMRGGVFVVSASYHHRAASKELLDAFGFEIGRVEGQPEDKEPQPMGFFKAPYFQVPNQYMCFVRFHEAWPVWCASKDSQILAYGHGGPPCGHMRKFGEGWIIVIGDTNFPLNINLEVESGQAFEGMRENPHFWRYILSKVRNGNWTPPNPKAKQG